MAEPDPSDRLKALDERIKAVKGETPDKHHSEEHYSQANVAWRMVTELVAGLGIGFGIGYGLDVLFGATPWLMVLFIFLGLAAGVKTMMRTAQEIQMGQQPDTGGEDGKDERDGD